MSARNHLRRLTPTNYQGFAVVHWTLTIRDRRTGWLDPRFYYHIRELLTHSLFRYAIACPVFTLMPEHLHMVWMGILEGSEQLKCMKHFRTRLNNSLQRIGFELQDQAYDNVFKEDQIDDDALINACEYIGRNPERSGLVSVDGYASYPFTGCIVPGYPELRPFEKEYWTRFHRSVSFLRREGLIRISNPRQIYQA